MVFIRFEGFILALLLVSFALQSVHVHGVLHQERRVLEANLIKDPQENDASLINKELVSGTLGIGSGSNKDVRIGGRKMGMKLKKEDEEMDSRSRTGDDQKLNVEADKNASEEGPQAFLNDQGQEKTTLETKNGKKIVFHDEQIDEWTKILEDANKKVMQMMKKDYGGMKLKPRRKPPINNHEPGN